MFEPFQDRNPHFFGTVSLSWFVMKSISKTYSFNLWPCGHKFLVFKVFKMKHYSRVTLHVSPKNQIQGTNWKLLPQSKLQLKLIHWVIRSKTNWTYPFSGWISWQISSNWLSQRTEGSDLERAQTSEHWAQESAILHLGLNTFVSHITEQYRLHENLAKRPKSWHMIDTTMPTPPPSPLDSIHLVDTFIQLLLWPWWSSHWGRQCKTKIARKRKVKVNKSHSEHLVRIGVHKWYFLKISVCADYLQTIFKNK